MKVGDNVASGIQAVDGRLLVIVHLQVSHPRRCRA